MEELILVDLNDNQIGTAEKLDAHVRGALHRAFSLFVVSGDDMLIHRRAAGKYHSAGLWTNACCSHPRNDEELERAVVRRTAHELGLALEACPPEEFSFIYRADFGALSEYEYDHVFLLETDERPALDPNPEEMSEVAWVSFENLSARLLANPGEFTAWFITAAPAVMDLVKKRRATR